MSRFVKQACGAFFIFLVTTTAALAQEPIWCFKPLGRAAADEAVDRSVSVRDFAHKFSGTDSYVYLKQLSADEKLAAFRRAAAADTKTSKLNTLSDHDLLEIDHVRKFVNEPMWFYYSNSKALNDAVHADNGSALEMSPAMEQTFLRSFDGKSSKGWLDVICAKAKPRLVVIESEIEVPPLFTDSKGPHPLVVRLKSSAIGDLSGKIDVIDSLRKTALSNVSVVNLLPRNSTEASAWNFDPHRAELYATSGRRINSDLRSYGVTPALPTTKKDALDAIRVASSKKAVIIIGESSDGGTSVRIPSVSETLTADDFSSLPTNVTVVGLICDSQNAIQTMNTMSVVGTLFTDETRSVLRVVLDRREPPSVGEFIGLENDHSYFAAAATSVSNAMRTFQGSEAGTDAERPYLVLLHGVAQGLSAGMAGIRTIPPSVSSSPSNNSNTINASALPPSQPVVPSKDPADASHIVLFVAGVLGGIAREIMRWKRLSNRGRADLYRKPKYLIIAVAEVLAGGAVAVIFGALPPSSQVQTVVAFVAGVGFEELVRRAARLEIWTPSVPQGSPSPDMATDSTALEFLRA